MRNAFNRIVTASAVVLVTAASATAQQAPPPPLAVPAPHYVSLPMEIAVNRPAADVWKAQKPAAVGIETLYPGFIDPALPTSIEKARQSDIARQRNALQVVRDVQIRLVQRRAAR